MNIHSFLIPSIIFHLLITSTYSSHNVDLSTDDVSINCGSTGIFPAPNGREWIGDIANPKSASFMQIKGHSTTSAATAKSISGDWVPYRSSRISRSRFVYSFHVGPGPKVLRFHFYPAQYKGFKGLEDLFTVQAGPFTLLGNFSASLAARALGVKSFAKEFCLFIHKNEQFNVSFTPESARSPDSYAFVNGIEIISVPENVSYFHNGDVGVQAVGRKSLVHIDRHTTLELVHRLNIIKESSVPAGGDLDDTFPMWDLRRAEKVKNRTWKVPVDVGFRYMIRLHISQMGLKIIARTSDYKVLINEAIALTNIDLENEPRNDWKRYYYKDYLVTMRGHKEEGKRRISISLHSLDELTVGLQLLSGFEIFKLTNPDNSLASPNPFPPPTQNPSSKTTRIFSSTFRSRNAFSFAALLVISIANIIAYKLRENLEAYNLARESDNNNNKPSAKAERLCRCFSLVEMQFATQDFNSGLIIGRGGFGKVYKGIIIIDRGCRKSVAIKRLKPNSSQGAHEFLMEIETLSELRHANLVSLIGYCNEHREMILVYDYMPGGTLADRLYRLRRMSGSCPPLSWKQRLEICIGAGRGLDYLHTGHGIIHRDVKSTNILLDENLVAKVSDFGLAKQEDMSKLQSHVSTRVKGTNGYMDPHYLHTRKLTRKTDTYAFGVVLFELLTGRPAVDLSLAEEEHILTIWARDRINKGEVEQIVDSSLEEEILPASLKTFVGISERCLREDPKSRPTMSQVVQQLELALEQQDSGPECLESNEVTSVGEERNSASNGQSPMADRHMADLEPSREEQTRRQAVTTTVVPPARRDERKRKPLRLWPWDAFWNRVKQPKKTSPLSDIGDEANIRATKYDWGMIAAATDQFSSNRKIGQGGFGSVYKGVLPTGQLVAVKRLKNDSTQGLIEFTKEIHYLPDLQHRNIIKLLGYCNHREEKLLVYEFMENGSVDTYIGDEVQCDLLQWEVRFKIIKGIARGLVYLHQDSGLRVIHRDPKLNNILLDSEMNPKISDFGLARTLAESDSQSETTRVAGTYGYIAPELFLTSKYSVKTDVYCFGIVIIEIVSSKRVVNWRRMNSYASGETKNFRGYAWELWKEGRVCDLVDERLERAYPEEEALRCVQVALLCTQTLPNQRPEMRTVLKMLEADEPLADPQETPPGNFLLARQYSTGSSSAATYELDDTLER
ncbi:Putative receptor-like protein kinase [Striga hermonthica]|uniref:non-specific serine/threonine protein kinase n=1 Tax=Striga hermonthica TaxID=68872 RepID=A0A9N7N7B8_STRHE|nr:Putative receptor-like protein kinase [Striga hermonthica]